MSDSICDINLIFSESPVSRAYLHLFAEEGRVLNNIILISHKSILNKFFLKLQYNHIFRFTKKYLRSPDVLIFINEVEKFFDLKKNFLKDMYNFENIYKFKNLIYANGPDINSASNINFFKNLENEYFLNSSNKIYKNIFNSNKKFYHIHPGYLYKVRGCDGTLNSIVNYESIGASIFLMDKKIDNGDILKRFEQKYYKLKFPNFEKYNEFDLYNIWFSFFDPALRVSFLRKLLKQQTSLNNFENIDKNNVENNYFKFINKNRLKEIFRDKIFKD